MIKYCQVYFKNHYETKFLEQLSDTDREVLEGFETFTFKKKYSGEREVDAGIHFVWLDIAFDEHFKLDNADVGVEFLLIKNPPVNYPFYSIPFDGMIGFESGRNGYGTSYNNEGEELLLNDETLTDVQTFETIQGCSVYDGAS